MSKSGNFYVDDDNNDSTDYFTPCTCMWGKYYYIHDTKLLIIVMEQAHKMACAVHFVYVSCVP